MVKAEKGFLNLEGVLIDFGYTLAYIDKEENGRYRQELVAVLEKHGYAVTLSELSPLLDSAYRSNRAGESKDTLEFWQSFLKRLGVAENSRVIEEFEKARKHWTPKTIKLYDGAVEALSYLKNKYRLALVSNCAPNLSEIVEGLGLNLFFEAIVLSYEVGSKKPDRQIYLSTGETQD